MPVINLDPKNLNLEQAYEEIIQRKSRINKEKNIVYSKYYSLDDLFSFVYSISDISTSICLFDPNNEGRILGNRQISQCFLTARTMSAFCKQKTFLTKQYYYLHIKKLDNTEEQNIRQIVDNFIEQKEIRYITQTNNEDEIIMNNYWIFKSPYIMKGTLELFFILNFTWDYFSYDLRRLFPSEKEIQFIGRLSFVKTKQDMGKIFLVFKLNHLRQLQELANTYRNIEQNYIF